MGPTAGLAAVLWAGPATPASAQPAERIRPIVLDLHGSLARYGQDPNLATPRALPVDTLPSQGLGAQAGVHVYPLRVGAVTFGLGGTLLISRGASSPDPDRTPPAVPVTTRFSALSPQLSFNFGDNDGWSYISGGIGYSTLSVTPSEQPEETGGDRLKTINYGGGARWFARPHLAFSFDVRFYAIAPTPATATFAGNPRITWVVFSAGISVH